MGSYFCVNRRLGIVLGLMLLLAFAYVFFPSPVPPQPPRQSASTTVPPVPVLEVPPDRVISEIEKSQEIADARNSSACDTIDTNVLPYARDMCHYTVAVNSRNESLCSGVRNDDLRATCVDRIRLFISVEADFTADEENFTYGETSLEVGQQ